MYRIEYLGRNGWWVGHKGIDLKDPAAYAAGVNKRRPARVIDVETGEIIGEPVVEVCPFCEEPHSGLKDGSCLL